MKTSLILICAFFFNTALLLGEPLSWLSGAINTWFLVAIEMVLLIVLYVNTILRGLKNELVFDFRNLNVFTFQGPRSKKNKESTLSGLSIDDLK